MSGYKKLISEKNFLKVRLRARKLMGNGTDLVAILYKDKRLLFKTASGTYGKKVIWHQIVEIDDATLENLQNAKFKDVETLIRESNLKISCNCPAFSFWGFKYIAWKKGYGLEKELRRPRVRNPHEKGFLCFVAGTRVLTESGYKNIEDIQIGDQVFSHKGRLCRVVAISSHEADETISIRYGSTWLRSTINHPYFASHYTGNSNPSTRKFNVDTLQWIPAGELNKGDFLVSPRLKLQHTYDVSSRDAFFTGLYAGDGSMQCRRYVGGHPSVHNGKYYCHGLCISLDSKYIENYKRIFNVYDIEASFGIQKSANGQTGVARVKDKGLWKRCLQFANFTNEEFGESKHIDILHWSEQAQREFIKGFFLADGTIVNGSGAKGNYKVYCTLFNTNKQMMEQILIVLKQWYDLKIESYDRKPFEEYGHIVYPKRMYYIRFTGAQCLDFIKNIVGEEVIACKSFGSKGFTESRYRLSEYTVDGIYYTPKILKELRYEGGAVVYNLQVEGDESYIVEDVAVHNCKHLYLVLSLYPFWAKTLAKKFKEWSESKEGAVSTQNKRFDSPRQNDENKLFGLENKPD